MEPDTHTAWVPKLAVAAVAVAALLAAFMAQQTDSLPGDQLVAQQSEPTGKQDAASAPAPMSSPSAQPPPVVKAPPLKSPPKDSVPARMFVKPAPATAMGGAAACKTCGTVELVVAVLEAGEPEPSGYQMHIRMDDGSTRTVLQRGAMAAGTRVALEGGVVKALVAPS